MPTQYPQNSASPKPGKAYRISGHESFPCRYAWLPKAVRGLQEDPKFFGDEESAMVKLGVGKNMVRSIRFWSQVMGMVQIETRGQSLSATDQGRILLAEKGLDPFLEDIQTLWLLHWNLATNVANPLLAWDFLLNRWQEPELVPSVVLKALQKEAEKQENRLSMVTLQQHFNTFLHTYYPTRGRKGEVQEDNLDCQLVELELIIKIGERELDHRSGAHETIYGFNREEKPDISSELFVYCLNDFWQKRHEVEATLTLREIAHGHGSPGQIFKLPEEDVRMRVEALARQADGFLEYMESANLQQVQKIRDRNSMDLLKKIYSGAVHDG
ncbi:MAG: DUF4007 family protein [Candidatus Poribacteria bacterium]|nr:DUF4007 family protein [Candidatus Poribacteria bacterium]